LFESKDSGRWTLSRTGFIDHVGIGVPDLAAAKQYYDDLMSVLGLREWFETGPGGPLNYGPDGARGSQLFFYQRRNRAPTHACKRAFITWPSWYRAERSSAKRTSGL
jgi:catechol 2,3-dioxygenase-like lactoylglutathione lyase family enzyme